MKKIALAAALTVAATGAFAGGYVEPAPVAEPVVVVEENTSSSSATIPLLVLAVIAAVAVAAD
ncbi:hypothetical protein [Palleronia caenipelagi]|uniref:Ferrochelatase n=1 Tax=Palleronia caenipelagi TaxID=2489174 RepID=A0A547Q6G3_9RHOB|nr:hypothetical protein [Palleronia caenipelagi]TRD21975.1 hypothetical protein FEV53_06260 [Palleronia caenipelagi]